MAQPKQRAPAKARGAGAPKPPQAPAPSSTGPPGRAPVCTVTFCPICAMVTVVGEFRPEFVQHAVAAGRELLLAMRAVIDARLEGMEEHPARLERLTIE